MSDEDIERVWNYLTEGEDGSFEENGRVYAWLTMERFWKDEFVEAMKGKTAVQK